MIQLMPDATEETAAKIEEIVRNAPPVTEMLEKGMTAEDILFFLTDGFDMLVSFCCARVKLAVYFST